jgi:hypothetical protein
MARGWSPALAALTLLLAASCAAQPTPQERVESTEQAALAPLKAKYPDIVTAFDISGNRLDLAIDANAYIQTGDDQIAAFKTDAKNAWRNAWIKAHPQQHAALTVRLMDFMNRVWGTEHTRA